MILAVPAVEAQEPAATLPLTLVERSPAEPPETAFDDDDSAQWVRYVYRNDSSQAIIAWDHRCIVATHSGHTGWSGSPHDAFSMLLIHPVKEAQWRVEERVIDPGETVEQVIGHTTGFSDGPFSAQTCGPTAVILADGSHAGAPEPLDDFFIRRRALVSKLRLLLQRLDERLDGPPDEPPGALLATLDFAERFSSVYVERAAAVKAASDRGGGRRQQLAALREVVQRDYARALEHLRPSDRKIVAGGRQ